MRDGKRKYKENIERYFQQKNTRKVWEGVSLISGHKGKRGDNSDVLLS